VTLFVAGAAALARADLPFQPEDQVTVTQVDNHLIAVTSRGSIETDIELGESVIAFRSQGFVGVIATNRRLLAVQSRSTDFAEIRYHLAEKPVSPDAIHVLDRLAVVELATRLVGFTPELGNWVELDLGPGEHPRKIDADGNIAAIVTPRRAIAFSSRSLGFIAEPLSPQEDVEEASFSDAAVTLVLAHKVLIFHAGASQWSSITR
jgi:hypothetical protein